ncbi:MAG TPA: hypothetical protein VMJ93_18285 [Verrucomicrobiae bacterium]|nr:hypothetical protein [Verrucomicrobiae bacterium]
MFISAFIFVISVAAVVQFMIQSWRSGLMRVATNPYMIKAEDPAASIYRKILETEDFKEVISYQKVCQDLRVAGSRNLSGVELYYSALRGIRTLGNWAGFQAASSWTVREMALCTRYAAVVMVQRLERNQSLAAEVRSY